MSKKRILALLLTLVMLFGTIPAAAAESTGSIPFEEIEATLLSGLEMTGVEAAEPLYSDSEMVRAIVVFDEQPAVTFSATGADFASDDAVIGRVQMLQSQQDRFISAVESQILDGEELDVNYQFTLVTNALSVNVPYGALAQMRELDGVKSVSVCPVFDLPADEDTLDEGINTIPAGEMISAPEAWESGLTGTGMKIAIIDTGIDADHPSFAATPDGAAVTSADQLAAIVPQLNAAKSYEGLTAEDTWVNGKIPFAFNYIDENLTIDHSADAQGDHGTHVAGIAAANAVEGTLVSGVAKDAQLFVMKVFGANGGAYMDDCVAAMEDALMLNVDVVNMSLGSPAGFSHESYSGVISEYERILDRLAQTDIIVCVSAGNNYTGAYGNGYGYDLSPAWQPDNGVIGSPSSYLGSLTVASVNNKINTSNAFVVDEQPITFSDSYTSYGFDSFLTLADVNDGVHQYVFIDGVGTEEDFAAVDVTGKIAVVSRGTTSFYEKANNAVANGAIATIVYNNQAGTISMNMTGYEGTQPAVSITQAAGAWMQAAADENGVGTLIVSKDMFQMQADDAYTMSSFSSRGPLADLTLKPEISGIGGNVYSTVDNGGYDNMSGTSMSSPQVAGASALVLEYVRQTTDLVGKEARDYAETLMMNTAVALVDEYLTYVSPRSQGAGLVNVKAATSTPSYVTVDGSVRAKAELGDDPDKTGVYTFDFTVHNTGDHSIDYDLRAVAMTEMPASDGYDFFMSGSSYELSTVNKFDIVSGSGSIRYTCDINGDGVIDEYDVDLLLAYVNGGDVEIENIDRFDLTEDGAVDILDVYAFYQAILGDEFFSAAYGDIYGAVLTVGAGDSLTVSVTMTLSVYDRDILDGYYENGMYVDGFVFVTPSVGDELSVPFLAFYGDWTSGDMFDDVTYADLETYYGYYYKVANNPDYPFSCWTTNNYFMGLNPWATDDEYIAERSNVLNPTKAQFAQIQDIYFGLIRSAKSIDVEYTKVYDGATGEEVSETLQTVHADYVRKDYYYSSYGVMYPSVLSWNIDNEDDSIFDTIAHGLQNGDKVTLTITGQLDYDGANSVQTKVVPITIDTVAPELENVECSMTEDGKLVANFTVVDNHYTAAILIADATGSSVLGKVAVNQQNAGETVEVGVNMSSLAGETVVIYVVDYGNNMSGYLITLPAIPEN